MTEQLFSINRERINGENKLLGAKLQDSLDHLSSYGVLRRVDGPVYRIIKTQWVEGDVFVMQNGKYLGRLVEVGEEQP